MFLNKLKGKKGNAELLCHKDSIFKSFVDKNPEVKQYDHPFWGKSSFLQTVVNVTTQRVYSDYTTIRVPTVKKRHVGLDILDCDLPKNSPIVLFFPGNQGDPTYYREHSEYFMKNGFRFAGYRRHVDKSFFNPIGHSEDVKYVIDFLCRKWPKSKIVLYGESIGTLAMIRYLMNTNDKRVKMVVGVSFMTTDCQTSIQNCSKMYRSRLVRVMTKEAGLKKEVIIDDKIDLLPFFSEYETREKLDAFLKSVEIHGLWGNLKTPCLLITSKDDKIILNSSFTSVTKNEICANTNVCILETSKGGHCGFFTKSNDTKRWHLRNSVLFSKFILGEK